MYSGQAPIIQWLHQQLLSPTRGQVAGMTCNIVSCPVPPGIKTAAVVHSSSMLIQLRGISGEFCKWVTDFPASGDGDSAHFPNRQSTVSQFNPVVWQFLWIQTVSPGRIQEAHKTQKVNNSQVLRMFLKLTRFIRSWPKLLEAETICGDWRLWEI